MKNNKGITLVALVVTIIVLLILAGVTIAMLTGDNGVLTEAKKAADSNKIGEYKDNVSVAVNAGMMKYMAAIYANNDSTADPKTYVDTELTALANANAGITYTSATGKVELESNGYKSEATVNSDGVLGTWSAVTK